MSLRRLVAENLGYALLGGPVLGIISFLVGNYLFGIGAAVAGAVVVYALGWALTVRQSDEGTRGSEPDSDDERTRRNKEMEMEKGSYGGSSGGG